jgi:hypothetical protein
MLGSECVNRVENVVRGSVLRHVSTGAALVLGEADVYPKLLDVTQQSLPAPPQRASFTDVGDKNDVTVDSTEPQRCYLNENALEVSPRQTLGVSPNVR